MSMMAAMYHRGIKRCLTDDEVELLTPRKFQRLRNKHQRNCAWIENHGSLYCESRATKILEEKNDDIQEYHCYAYMKFYTATYKCTIDVIMKPKHDVMSDNGSVLLGKTRIAKLVKPGVIRVRLVSTLFAADTDVFEDSSLIKLEIISCGQVDNSFDKQFALKLNSCRVGPGVIGKLFVEPLDPSSGSYTNESPIFELNLSLAFEHKVISTASGQNHEKRLACGCFLSPDSSRLNISDECNLRFDDAKLVHRLAEHLRCHWKHIGRELSPCFSETDLIDIQQTYFVRDGNHECTFQLLREWYTRQPEQANIRYLVSRLKLPFDLILTIHGDVVKRFVHNEI